jgi:hypothetical protein
MFFAISAILKEVNALNNHPFFNRLQYFTMRFLYSSLLLVAILFSASTSVNAQSETELQELYQGVLKQIGVASEVDGDGDVTFEYEEHSYFFEVNEDDTEFYRLVIPNIWPIESELERLSVLKAVNSVNMTKKVAKAYVVNDNVWIAVELFVDKPDDFIGQLERHLNVIEQSIELFVDEMQ